MRRKGEGEDEEGRIEGWEEEAEEAREKIIKMENILVSFHSPVWRTICVKTNCHRVTNSF